LLVEEGTAVVGLVVGCGDGDGVGMAEGGEEGLAVGDGVGS